MKPNSLTAIVAGPSPGNTFLRTTRAVLEALALINVLTRGGGGLVSAQPQPPYSQEANKLYEEHQSHYDQVLPSRLVHPGKYPGVGPGPGPLIKGVDKRYAQLECS